MQLRGKEQTFQSFKVFQICILFRPPKTIFYDSCRKCDGVIRVIYKFSE